MGASDEVILNGILFDWFFPQVENIVDVVHFIMGVLDMLLKSLQLKVYFKTILATNKAKLLLVFLDGLSFFSELWKFVDDGACKDLKDDFLSE